MFVFKDVLVKGISSRASDIHLGAGTVPAIRVDGKLTQCTEFAPLTREDMEGVVNAMLVQEQREVFYKEREHDFSFELLYGNNDKQRFRANLYFERGNIVLALRIINPNVRTLDQLCLPQELREIAKKNNGLFLVTGPTGSGKSTTLAAVINEINMTRPVHIITVEDPIEYIYESARALIHQREVGSDTKSFAEALRRAMREDPDVILIGEMRDLETIAAAVTAAETGHLVFATLHTPDAPQTIDRIIDVFPSHQQQQIRVQLSSILIGVLSQQLIPVAAGSGRMVATEFMMANSAVRNSIRDAKTTQIKNAIQTGASLGMHTMDQDLARMVKEGLITKKDAVAYAYDHKELDRYLM